MHRTPREFGSRLVKFHHANGIVDSRGTESDGRPAVTRVDTPQFSLVRIEPRVPRRYRFPFLQFAARLLLLVLAITALELALLSAIAPALLRQDVWIGASR
jgi:hypothetical protein